ncbi:MULTISPECIES: hypothetical protein [Paenibacillus]|uniref:Uncharacterized protein n=1 Tax=Paenibacillus naphthalenovorans TaxID=162209 RepID=A0A0U2M4Q6_9BACL|nr:MULTISPECIES: hypothetical protein [Paenibacillus]ALS22656.1 hypothetical protein IJ22_22820 [Paenibacillus naphthalenovorans]NTZ17732.1 hypothetical protein [Paenibacillus sp. JMULE4]GCL70453.1 hypothetical protein PN4B1_03540 [Paenibacillus naphthalenovorans]SDH81860.1 hypothetical protein SAMN05421868_101210 [Paenibacillus naphthalenovorans]
MNLADMLSYADIHELSRIAVTYHCECNGHSKNELIQSILCAVGRREVFDTQVEALSIEDIRFLNSLLFDQRGSFSLEELIARVQQSRFTKDDENTAWNPREMISRFKQRGWLFSGYSHQTRYLFQLPADLKSRFILVLARQFQQKLQTTEEPPVYRDEQRFLAEDIWSFLHFLRSQEVILTAENVMYKRNLQQILERLAVREDPVGKTAWRFGYGRMFREYPNRFSFIYDYCYYNDLITEHNQVLALTSKGEAKVDEGQKDDPFQVYRFWLRLYKGPIPNLQSLVHWLSRLGKSWVTYHSLREVLTPLIRPYYYDTADSILDQRIIQMMMHLGLLRIGEDERWGRVVQVTKLGSHIIEGTYVPDEEKITIDV